MSDTTINESDTIIKSGTLVKSDTITKSDIITNNEAITKSDAITNDIITKNEAITKGDAITNDMITRNDTINNDTITKNGTLFKNGTFTKSGKMIKSATVSTFDTCKTTKSERKRRILKKEYFSSIKSVIIIFILIILLYGIFYGCMKIYEKLQANTYDYGIKINIGNHNMVINIDGEKNDKVLVIIPGLGSPSPVLQYRPISDALSDKYKVIIMEPFGYGLSDVVKEERTIENIVSELHGVIKEQLKIDKYYLLGHSLGGLYSLYWSDKYSNEVLGFIGFDTIVPEIETISNYKDILNELNFIDDQYVKSKNNNQKKLFSSLYPKYNYNGEEIEMYRILSSQNKFNKSVQNEYSLLEYNLKMTQGMKFPKIIPVINFICSDNTDRIPAWKQIHDNVGNESTSNEVIELTGNHFYFVMDNFDTITPKLNEFIK
jgi:hypothetical protein